MTAGIYKITNRANGRAYIGQSVQVELRVHRHFKFLKAGTHFSAPMQEDFDSGQAFDWELVEEVSDPEKLTPREIYWVNFYNTLSDSGYNRRLPGGGRPRGEGPSGQDYKELGFAIFRRRREARLSQKRLAGLLGISSSYLSDIEWGEVRGIPTVVLGNIARVLEIEALP